MKLTSTRLLLPSTAAFAAFILFPVATLANKRASIPIRYEISMSASTFSEGEASALKYLNGPRVDGVNDFSNSFYSYENVMQFQLSHNSGMLQSTDPSALGDIQIKPEYLAQATLSCDDIEYVTRGISVSGTITLRDKQAGTRGCSRCSITPKIQDPQFPGSAGLQLNVGCFAQSRISNSFGYMHALNSPAVITTVTIPSVRNLDYSDDWSTSGSFSLDLSSLYPGIEEAYRLAYTGTRPPETFVVKIGCLAWPKRESDRIMLAGQSIFDQRGEDVGTNLQASIISGLRQAERQGKRYLPRNLPKDGFVTGFYQSYVFRSQSEYEASRTIPATQYASAQVPGLRVSENSRRTGCFSGVYLPLGPITISTSGGCTDSETYSSLSGTTRNAEPILSFRDPQEFRDAVQRHFNAVGSFVRAHAEGASRPAPRSSAGSSGLRTRDFEGR